MGVTARATRTRYVRMGARSAGTGPGRPDAHRITVHCYEGGHMMYEEHNARFALARDITRFYQGAPGVAR